MWTDVKHDCMVLVEQQNWLESLLYIMLNMWPTSTMTEKFLLKIAACQPITEPETRGIRPIVWQQRKKNNLVCASFAQQAVFVEKRNKQKQ